MFKKLSHPGLPLCQLSSHFYHNMIIDFYQKRFTKCYNHININTYFRLVVNSWRIKNFLKDTGNMLGGKTVNVMLSCNAFGSAVIQLIRNDMHKTFQFVYQVVGWETKNERKSKFNNKKKIHVNRRASHRKSRRYLCHKTRQDKSWSEDEEERKK